MARLARVGVLGVGGVGGWLGARLAEAKTAQVVLIARGAHGSAIREKGLCLRVPAVDGSPADLVQLQPGATEVYSSVAEAVEKGAEPLDYMILGVKTWQVHEAAKDAAPLLALDGGCVVTTQNGVEAPQAAAEAVGAGRVLGGTARVFAYLVEPGLVEMQPNPSVMLVGEVFDSSGAELHGEGVSASQRATRLVEAFASCRGTTVEVAAPNFWMRFWEKAVLMCSTGPVGALCRAPINVIYKTPATKELLRSAMLEVAACADAAGHIAEGKTPEALVDFFLENNIRLTKPGTTPSTLRDIVTGQPSELHELTGAILRAGERLKVPTPTHRLIYAALLPQELRARGEEPYTLMGVPGGAPHINGKA